MRSKIEMTTPTEIQIQEFPPIEIQEFDHKAGKSERTPFDRSHYDNGNVDIMLAVVLIGLFLLCFGG